MKLGIIPFLFPCVWSPSGPPLSVPLQHLVLFQFQSPNLLMMSILVHGVSKLQFISVTGDGVGLGVTGTSLGRVTGDGVGLGVTGTGLGRVTGDGVGLGVTGTGLGRVTGDGVGLGVTGTGLGLGLLITETGLLESAIHKYYKSFTAVQVPIRVKI